MRWCGHESIAILRHSPDPPNPPQEPIVHSPQEVVEQIRHALHNDHFFGTRPVAKTMVLEAVAAIETLDSAMHEIHDVAEASAGADADQLRTALDRVAEMSAQREAVS